MSPFLLPHATPAPCAGDQDSAAGQSPPAPVCEEAGEDNPLRDQEEGTLSTGPRRYLGRSGAGR